MSDTFIVFSELLPSFPVLCSLLDEATTYVKKGSSDAPRRYPTGTIVMVESLGRSFGDRGLVAVARPVGSDGTPDRSVCYVSGDRLRVIPDEQAAAVHGRIRSRSSSVSSADAKPVAGLTLPEASTMPARKPLPTVRR